MQSNQRFHPSKDMPAIASQAGHNYMNIPLASAFGGALPPCAKPFPPLNAIEFQPSDVCPKNFIIFDQTDHVSQVMFNPAIAHKFGSHCLNNLASYIPDNHEMENVNDGERETSSFLKEDSDDIDALLSSEEEEQEEYDEEISTARTYGFYGNDSPDSCSNYDSKPMKKISSALKSSSHGGSHNGEIKRKKMRKMVKILRGIVPGGDQMDTVSVFDEAVRYLKSLKVEVQKLGVGDIGNQGQLFP